MLPLAHVGLTLGAACLIKGALSRKQGTLAACTDDCSQSYVTASPKIWQMIDYRLIMLGALLPDIIDKPIGVLFHSTFGTGRLFCHTLLFLVIVVIAGIYLYKRRHRPWLLLIAFGVFTHLILDLMWLEPRTLLWPAYGFTFPVDEWTSIGNWLSDMWHGFLANPVISTPEIMGALILAVFFAALIRRKKLYSFVRYGLT
jgi:inner membrane protein